MKAAILAGAARPAGAASPAPGQPAAVAPADPAKPAGVPGADPLGAGPAPGQPASDDIEPPGLVAARKAEIHAKRQIAAERAQMQADFDGQKAQWQERITKAQQVENAIANARANPMGLLTAAGFAEGDLEALAHLIYAHTPAGQKDPKRREAAAAALAQREAHGRLDKTERELAELKKGLTDREQQAVQQQQAQAFVGQWLGTVTGAIGEANPLAKAAASAQPERLHSRLLAITDRMWLESGPSDDLREMPEPAGVIAAYERERRAELEAARAEYELLTKGTAAPASPPAAAAPAVAPVVTPAAAATPPASPPLNGAKKLSREELLEGIKKQRAALAQ